MRSCGNKHLKCGTDLFKDVYSKMPMIQTLAIISKSWIVQEGVEHWPEDEGEVKKPINN